MYQGARNVYCRYPRLGSKTIELVYDLTDRPLMFLDAGLVFPGTIIYTDRAGNCHPLHATGQYYGDTRLTKDEVVGRPFRAPSGVRIEAQKAEQGPTIDEFDFFGTSSLRYDEGVYRCWYNTRESLGPFGVKAKTEIDEQKGFDLASRAMLLRYAESDNGVDWRKPQLDVVEVGGISSNIVYGSVLEPERGFSGMSVFIDPSAPPAERYKGMFGGRMRSDKLVEYCRRIGTQPDPMSIAVPLSHMSPDEAAERGIYEAVVGGRLPDGLAGLPELDTMVVYGAVSPDGMKWTSLDDPVMPFMTEHVEPFYDVEKGRYVDYPRYWHNAQRRGIGISETDDFAHWPLPRPLLCPGLGAPLTDDFYTTCHTLYPGTTDVHLFFIANYYRGTNDCVDVDLAVSLDGDLFDIVPGGRVLDCDTEAWDPDQSGPPACVFPMKGLVPFGDDRVGIITREDNVPHKWPRTCQWQHTFRWALWKKERLVALRAEGDGRFTTAGLILTRPNICVNACTEPKGLITAQLLDETGEPVPGYDHDECDPINGDHLKATLTWQGKQVPAKMAGRKIYLQFRMSHARLFSISASE